MAGSYVRMGAGFHLRVDTQCDGGGFSTAVRQR
jgi:hypothetical protein